MKQPHHHFLILRQLNKFPAILDMAKKLKKYSLDEIKDEVVGKKGSSKRDAYEYELQMDIIGELIKKGK